MKHNTSVSSDISRAWAPSSGCEIYITNEYLPGRAVTTSAHLSHTSEAGFSEAKHMYRALAEIIDVLLYDHNRLTALLHSGHLQRSQ